MTGTFDPWVGRVEEAVDTVSPRQARQMAATLGVACDCAAGAVLPVLWHWMGWTPEAPMAELGPDGHPARGGFLPPVPLERRMWAGGRLRFHAPLRIGQEMRRRSEIVKVSEKTGTTGRMVFVTFAHRVEGSEGLAVEEEQDIVYIAMPDRFTPPPPVAAPVADWAEPVAVDEVRLFRFSALTFNAHRIHFDLPYATGVEKYPGLVVHGPLQAMLLMQAARARRGGAVPAGYRFRGVRPAFHFDALTLQGAGDGVATVNGDGLVCMQAGMEWE
ncbi:MAG: acyl dehydratase [Rhodobacter sp. CACIA14H1]|nr:MAG: acyl dehydratase [Rhodobacter sp. CACIA14H1]